MKKIIGLDLGTTSIGWAYVHESEHVEEQSSIVGLGVRVNPLSTDEKTNFDKGNTITTNAERTLKRGARRNLQRYKLHREQLKNGLVKSGLISESAILCEIGENTTYETYRLRAQAVDEEISLEAFARVLLMINKKRGYKSSRKADSGEEGTLVDGMEVAKLLYNKKWTPGQYLLELHGANKKTKPEFYRSDLQAELERIWAFQQPFHPEILTEQLKNDIEGKNRTQTSSIFYAKHKVTTAVNKGKDKQLQALKWRVDALQRRLDIEEVAFVVCELNGAISSGSQYLARISDRSKILYFKKQTVGQYLFELLQENRHASLRNLTFYRQDYIDEFERLWDSQARFHAVLTDELKKEVKTVIFYQRPLRSCKHLISVCEFEQEKKEVVDPEGRKKQIIVGAKACPKSSPLFQEFKVWHKLNDVILFPQGGQVKKAKKSRQPLSLFDDAGPEETPRPLTQEEKERLYKELYIKEKLSKKDALIILFGKKHGWDMNLENLEGNYTGKALFEAYREIIALTGNGEYDFAKLPADEVFRLTKEIFEGLGYKTDFLHFDSGLEKKNMERQPAYRLWHLLYSYAGDNSITGLDALVRKIGDLCGFEPEYARILADKHFQPDYGSLSAKSIRKLLPHMKAGLTYTQACEEVYGTHSLRSLTKEQLEAKTYKDRLENLKRNSLRNPVVEKILNQMINLVNELIATYGRPDEIRIELARELKKSSKERKELTQAIDRNTKDSNRIREILKKELTRVTRNDILRYRLYEELKANGYKTLYSGTYIPREELFGNKFDIEHIIPKSRLFNDSFGNKTLELRSVNIEKSNMTAYDYICGKNSPEGIEEYKKRVENLMKEGAISQGKRNYLLMSEGDIPTDFLERDLRNTQYIAKKALELLEEIVPKVVATTGAVTDRLREDWGLLDVMQELNWGKYAALGLTTSFTDEHGKVHRRIIDWTKRNDHRHHAMDALTVAFTKAGIIQYLNNLNAKSEPGSVIYAIEKKELSRENGKLVFNAPMPRHEFRAQAKKHLEQILVSIKSKNKVTTKNVNKAKCKDGIKRTVQLTPRGELHKETIYGQIQEYRPVWQKIDGKLTAEIIAKVADKQIREALTARLNQYDGDAGKAFSKKNLQKSPICLSENRQLHALDKVKLTNYEKVYTIKKSISSDIKIDKVVDPVIKRLLLERLKEFDNDPDKAFSNLDERPIWLNKEKGISVKKVKIQGIANGTPIRSKRDIRGELIRDEQGRSVPGDFVNTGNNHHVAIYRDEEGNLQENVVSFYEATVRSMLGYSIIDKNYKSELGWEFLFTLKQNEFFVFPNSKTGFDPSEIDLCDEANYALISPNLFRVQKCSSKDYYFRHHLETTVGYDKTLQETTWKRIRIVNQLQGIIKVRINHIGKIVGVGEY